MTEDVKKGSDPENQGDDKRETSLPNDGSYVPRERLNDVLAEGRSKDDVIQSLRSDLARLGAADAQQEPSEPEREHTRSELGQMVEDGRLTQEAAGRILDEQQERRTQKTVAKAVHDTVAATTRGQRLQDQIDSYTAAIPEVSQAGTDARKKVEKEYHYLTGLGHPDSLETEVAALRAAFGEVGLIRSGKSARETHQEVGAGDGESVEKTSDGAPKGLSRDAKKHYGAQIERGMYANWAAVSKELEGASPSVKARLGL